jgi:phosphatidate cytidylyltransferase
MNEIAVRALSGLVYITLLLAAIFFSQHTYFFLLIILGGLTLMEFSNLQQKPVFSFILLHMIVLCGVHFAYIPVSWIQLLLPVFIGINLWLLVGLFFPEKGKLTLLHYLIYLYGGFICLYLLGFTNGAYTPTLIVGIFVIIWANDIFAYLVGRFLGKRKLFKRVSPKKTIEGFIGGLVASLVTGIVIYTTIQQYSWHFWIFLALLVSILGTLGDLIQSQLKREKNVKDSGSLMPGHGGIYDRVDSIVFTTPFIYHYILLHHVS